MKDLFSSTLNNYLFVFLFLNLSCAIVTINVYFPAEEVKDVFKALEDELLENGEEDNNSEGIPEETEIEQESIQQESATDSDQTSFIYPSQPNIRASKIIATKRVFRLVPEVYADIGLTNKILNMIKSDPAVQKAYDRRNGRLSSINKILSKRLAGEGNKGLMVPRGKLSDSDTKAVKDENADRQIIIEGMAKAIIKIDKLEATPDIVKSVKPRAAEQFAAVRRDEVKSGTLVQLPDGKWIAN
jgi:hypothetical protein